MTVHQKMNMLVFYKHMSKKRRFSSLTIMWSSIVFIFSSPTKKSLQQRFTAMGPCLFLLEHSLCLVRSCQWIMQALNMCLLGTSNFMVTLMMIIMIIINLGVNRSGHGTSSTTNYNFFQGLGTTSWSTVQTTPNYILPQNMGPTKSYLFKAS